MSQKITERNVRGRRNVVKGGRIMLHGNHPPYGYRVSGDCKMLVVYEPEARIIRLIFVWYTEGDENGERLSMYRIVKKLTEMGVPTWGDTNGSTTKKRGVGNWALGTVSKILHSKTYMGQWSYGKVNRKGGKNLPEHWNCFCQAKTDPFDDRKCTHLRGLAGTLTTEKRPI